MTGPLDILSKLHPLVWDGIEVPCQANSLEFGHRQVHHEQHSVHGAPVEGTGRHNARYGFRIPFRRGIDGYPDLYPERFRKFWNSCLDGELKTLIHPEFGTMDAKVESFRLGVDPNVRDGYDVDVVWTETTENALGLDAAGDSQINAAVVMAANLESLSGQVNPPIEFSDGSGMSLLAAMKKLQFVMQSAQFTVDSALTQIAGVLAGINAMIDTANSITDPKAWGLSQGLKEIARLLSEGQEKLNNSKTRKRVQFIIAAASIDVAQAASGAKMALEEFFKLNPRLALVKTIAKDREYFVLV